MKQHIPELSRRQLLAALTMTSLGGLAKGSVVNKPKRVTRPGMNRGSGVVKFDAKVSRDGQQDTTTRLSVDIATTVVIVCASSLSQGHISADAEDECSTAQTPSYSGLTLRRPDLAISKTTPRPRNSSSERYEKGADLTALKQDYSIWCYIDLLRPGTKTGMNFVAPIFSKFAASRNLLFVRPTAITHRTAT